MADNDSVNLATLGAEAELVNLGTAVAEILTRLNEVSAQQQRAVLQLVIGASAAVRAEEPVQAPESKEMAFAAPPPAAHESSPSESNASGAGTQSVHPDEARARALAAAYEAAAHALGLAFQNAVANQQQLNTLGNAALAQASSLVLESAAGGERRAVGVLKAG